MKLVDFITAAKKFNHFTDVCDESEIEKIVSIIARPYATFTTANGQNVPAGISYQLATKEGAFKVKCTEKTFNSFVCLVNSNIPNTDYKKYVTLTHFEGKNTEGEEYEVNTFTCIYNPIEEQAE